MPSPSSEELDNRFTYHPPKAEYKQQERYDAIWREARVLAGDIARFTIFSREQSLALTALEEAVFWANAAIARNE